MNILKLITQNGRRAYVREQLKKYLTPSAIAEYAADGVNKMLRQIQDKEKLDGIASTVSNAADFTARLAEAVRDGEVTNDEATILVASAQSLVGSALTAEKLNALIERVLQYVP